MALTRKAAKSHLYARSILVSVIDIPKPDCKVKPHRYFKIPISASGKGEPSPFGAGERVFR
jgi:hypothetical protein